MPKLFTKSEHQFPRLEAVLTWLGGHTGEGRAAAPSGHASRSGRGLYRAEWMVQGGSWGVRGGLPRQLWQGCFVRKMRDRVLHG